MSKPSLYLALILIVVALAAVGCKKTPNVACENILSITEQETSKANIDACIATYFWPLRQAGSLGEINEEPHMLCYIEAKSKEDVDKCLAALLDDAAKVPGSDVAKARAAKTAEAEMGAEAAEKGVRLEACVSQCSAAVPDAASPEYSACMSACKQAAGL